MQTSGAIFAVQVSDHGEELALTGPVAILEQAGTLTAMTRDGEGVIYTLLTEFHDYKTDCNKDNGRLSECLKEYINSQHGGNCRLPWEKQAVGKDLEVCSAEAIYERAVMLEKLKMDGLRVITNITGCQLPCERLFFRGTTAVRQTPYLVFPRECQLFPIIISLTTIFILKMVYCRVG